MNQPRSHQHIEVRAVYTDDFVRVYQAFRDEIAEEAVRLGNFGPHFGLNRMTWIKPSFLWMMYRSGWAEKPGQENILAIDIKREAFDYLLENAVRSTYRASSGITQEEWKTRVRQSDIRCQWDPERNPYGRALSRRSLQIGIRGKVVREHYVKDWILHIENITSYVRQLKRQLDGGEDISGLLPQEKIYPMTQAARENFACVIRRKNRRNDE